MIDALRRKLGLSQAPAIEAETQNEGVVEMTTEVINEGAALADQLPEAADLLATVASLTEQLAAASGQIAELTAQVQAATEFKAAQEKAAAEAKIAARVEALTGIVGTEQAAGLHAATASMDDAGFNALVSALSHKSTTEANTAAFKEVGAEGSTDQTKLAAEVHGGKTADYLQAIIKNELK